MADRPNEEIVAIIEIIRCEHERCKAEVVDRGAALVRVLAAGQAEIDRLWPGVWEVEGEIDEQHRLAFTARRRDRPRYDLVLDAEQR